MDKFFKKAKPVEPEVKETKSSGALPALIKVAALVAASFFAKQYLDGSSKKPKRENVVFEVHLKKGFEPWKKLFDEDGKNRVDMCDESRTTAAKVSDSLAIVNLYDVDMEKLAEFTSDPDFAKMIEPYVEKHVPYIATAM